MLAALKEDIHSDVLLRKVAEDTALGRMSGVRELTEEDVRTLVLSPRSCVEQGVCYKAADCECTCSLAFATQALTGMENRSFARPTTSHGRS